MRQVPVLLGITGNNLTLCIYSVLDYHFLDSFLYASMLAIWKSDATLRIFREPYRAILHSSPSLKQKREAFAMLPKCKVKEKN